MVTEATRQEQITSGLKSPMLEQEVQFGDVHFTIRKLLPMDGYRLFEKIRPALEQLADAIQGLELSSLDMPTGMKIAGAIPEDILEEARKRLYAQVFFTSPTHPHPTPLLGNEDGAFAALTFYHPYELTVRCMIINFTESWDAFQSRMPSASQTTMQSASETSPPSSPTQ